MIEPFYEVTCDYCGRVINHYPRKRPSADVLKKDGIVVTATKHFCSSICYADWNHSLWERRYLNLHPDGRIHHE